MARADATIDAAIAWHLRQTDAPEADWEAFVAWLEESPAHAEAYDRVAAADRLVGEARPAVFADTAAASPVVIDASSRFGRRPVPARRWGWATGIASVAAALVAALLPRGGPRPYAIETRPGETRVLTVAGTRVDLDGGSRLVLDRADPRVARLESGQALFRVVHDAVHPFAIRSGGITVTDIGTVFDVTRVGRRLSVAVAQGSVAVTGAGAPVSVVAGQRLSVDEAANAATLAPVAAGDIGAWTTGRLSFDDVSLVAVAAGLERRYAVSVALAPGLRDRPFTGSIRLTGSAERDIPHLAALIGVNWRHHGGEWVLGASSARAP